jgi:hypothetical protein
MVRDLVGFVLVEFVAGEVLIREESARGVYYADELGTVSWRKGDGAA